MPPCREANIGIFLLEPRTAWYHAGCARLALRMLASMRAAAANARSAKPIMRRHFQRGSHFFRQAYLPGEGKR